MPKIDGLTACALRSRPPKPPNVGREIGAALVAADDVDPAQFERWQRAMLILSRGVGLVNPTLWLLSFRFRKVSQVS